MTTKIKEENERIQRKNREARQKIYENMESVLNEKTDCDGINAILKFLNEKERVNTELPMSEQLWHIEEKLFIKIRYVELDKDWYTASVIPMLVKTVRGHWVAVTPNAGGTCDYTDNGKKSRITRKNADLFTNNAMYFYKVMKNGKITMRDLILFMAKCSSKRDRLAVFIAAALTTAAGMMLPWANSFIFSVIVPSGAVSDAPAAAALVFSAVLLSALLGLVRSLILTNTMLRTTTYVQSAIFSRMLSLKPEFFNNVKSGELSRMIMEFSDVTQIVSVEGISACIGVILSFVYLIQIYIYAPALFPLIIIVTIIQYAMMAAEGILNSKWMKNYSGSLSGMSGFCYEMFSGIEQIKLSGAETRVMRRWSERYADVSQKEIKPFPLKYADVIYKIIRVFATAAIFLFGAELKAPNYIAFSAAYGAFTAASTGASVIIRMTAGFRSSYSLIKPMLTAECEEYGSGKKRPDKLRGDITVTDLYFRYGEDAPYVLKGLSASIKAGESVGIIGVSGCGKSTLIRLLLGFESPNEGSIYIDGFDLRELDLKSCRQKIGVVLQNSGLISGDIYSNITITKPNASMEEVDRAVETAGLKEDIAALPMGLHTPVSQDNCTLSGGQRQRLLIARAIINNPSILIFDEATSALDNVTQAKIIDGINNLKCTKIIVAHRLSTIEKCDKIFVMDNGVIAQEGTFDELKDNEGLLKKFAKKQIAV